MSSTLPSSTQVLIVGAGPTGLACALGLAARNVPFVLVDALLEGHTASKAVLMQPNGLEALEAVEPTLPAAVVASGIPAETTRAIDVKENSIFTVRVKDALLGKTKYPFCLLIPQHRVEARMREALVEKGLGKSLVWGKRVSKLRETEGTRWEVGFESGEVISARYVVAADGSESTIRKLAGIRYLNPYAKTPTESTPDDKDLNRSFVVADVVFADPLPANVPTDALQLMVGGGGGILIAPIGPEAPDTRNVFRLYIGVPGTPPPPSKPDLPYLQAALDARGPGSHTKTHPIPQIAQVLDSGRYRTRAALAEHYVRRAANGGAYVLLAGDAAHKHGPAGGQGMNLGICDAVELASLIAEHLSGASAGRDAAELFDGYETRRREIARQVIDMVEGMTELERGGTDWNSWLQVNMLWTISRLPFMNGVMAWKVSGLWHGGKSVPNFPKSGIYSLMSTLPSSTEVLIVGAGPTGLACALGLAARDVPFVLVDALLEGHTASKSVLTHPNALEALEAVAPALPAAIVASGNPAEIMQTLDAHERSVFSIRVKDALAGKTKYPFCLLIPQHRVEARMREALAAKGVGNAVVWGKRVSELRETDAAEGTRWEVGFESGEVVAARYVVAADGSESTVRKLAGIRYLNPYEKTHTESTPNDKINRSFIVADVVFAEPLPPNLPTNALQLIVGTPGGGVLTAPIGPESPDTTGSGRNVFRIYGSLDGTPPSKPDLPYLQAMLDARGPGSHNKTHPVPQIAKVLDSARYRTRPALAERYFRRAANGAAYVLLAGDAAHKHGPSGGQGMNLGICDAVELALLIEEHLSGVSSSGVEKPRDAVELFDGYESRRRSVARQVIDMVSEMEELEGGGVDWKSWVHVNVLWTISRLPFMNGIMAWRVSGLWHGGKK
ncbi:FAD/NAD(P)-binding domain-containing protein [Mycena chlorophos]|uniref:FAD/NAD(P)-binding domain-containing protein n=1 Tax=Mycena chlorophos TaxID=658473 RepID=A0A8H6VW58_MYCCL|nr:FAD/NAD(P)-binding domain-containing protein [Mycena chlorophos]